MREKIRHLGVLMVVALAVIFIGKMVAETIQPSEGLVIHLPSN